MAIKDKKDVSVLVEAQIPEFVTSEHPKFKYFIEKYYEFMESQQVYFTGFTFDEDKLVDESDGTSYFLYEDEVLIQLESDRDTAANANLCFSIGETLTGNTSTATAVVTGTKGNTLAFIKPTNEATFKIDEKITGSTSRAYAVLANGISANVFPEGSIESFRSRGAVAATRDLENMQDIDKTNEGLIDDAWKKEFYTNIPTATKTDRRQLLKNMKEVYQSKGNENSFTWLFRALYAKEDVQFYYPKNDMSKLSHGKWTLDKSIKILTSSANNINLFVGNKITGTGSNATAVVESFITSFVGSLEVTELILSGVVAGLSSDGSLENFKIGEPVQTEADANGDIALGYTLGMMTSVTVNAGGTDYIVGDEIVVAGGGGSDARARVGTTQDDVIQTVTLVDAGDGYSVGDPVGFIDEGTGGSGAAGEVGTIIKTSEVLINSEIIDAYAEQVIGNTAILVSSSPSVTANSHLYGNSSLVFTTAIKASTAKYFDSTANFANSHLAPGDRIAKQISIDETTAGQLTQSGTTVTLATGLTHAETLDVVGGKLTYANGNNTIITNFTNTTTLTVKDSHTIGSVQDWDIYYRSNTHWGTIIGANSTQVLYAIGSYDRDKDLSTFSANNFSNNDSVIVYDVNKTKAWAAKAANSYDSHMTHTGVTFDIGNTPASNSATSYTTVDGQGPLYPLDLVQDTTGGFTMTTVNVGAIDTISMTTVGSSYATTPAVNISNNHIQIYQNARDVLGVTSTLINVNLHSYDTGTITQSGSVITLTSGSFPEANSGLNKITYANGLIDTIVTVTNTTSLIMSTERLISSAETYTLTYGAIANNFTRNTLLYNDDWTARGRTLDFIDQSISRKGKPAITTGNTTLRVSMLTAQDFSSVEEFLLYESRDLTNTPEIILLEDTNKILVEDSVEFISMNSTDGSADADDELLFEDESRIYTEATTGDRVTAYSNATSTYTTNTITQSGTTVTGIGTVFPNHFVRGTITYADDATSTITAYTNATSFTVEDSKTIGSAQAYSISYNPVLTHGSARVVTLAAGGTGNRTVTVTDAGHNFKTGSKVLVSNNATLIFDGSYEITNAGANTYTYTLPEDTAVTSPAGLGGTDIVVQPVATAYLATSNAVTMDTSPKGNNATLAVLSIATGSIRTVEVYNFGAGYTSAPTLSAAGGNQDASFTANLGAYGEYGGYYTGTTGLLSGVPKIQDGKYYQDFSYVLKTDFDVNVYRNDVKRITHPSGMLMFGELAISNKVSAAMFDAGASGNVDSTFAIVGPDARKYHTCEVTINSYANLQYKSSNTQPELEIFTSKHPWHAIDARLAVRGDDNLLEEDFREVTVARSNSTVFTVTETLHGLAAGDTVYINGFPGGISTDYWDGKYVIQTIPTTNTYTITPQRGDPGAGVTADPNYYIVLDSTDGSADAGDNIIMEDVDGNDLLLADGSIDSLKVETISLANTWLANTANWDSPFNSSFLMEIATDPSAANDEKILMEQQGGAFLYPTLQFPEAETGTVSIDMSFNSDILLEDYTTGDLGMESSGYLLDEQSGSAGTGPQRYISLEEDSQGYDHQYESIPFTHVDVSWTNSQTTGWLILQEDESGGILYEDDLDPTLGQRMLTEYSHVTTSDEGHFKRVRPEVEYTLNQTGFNNVITEDENFIILEVEATNPARVDYLRTEGDTAKIKGTSTFTPLATPVLYDTLGWHIRGEDDSYIINEDATRSLIEEGLNKTPETHIHFDSSSTESSSELEKTIGQNNEIINDHKDRYIGSTFGLQVFRPHYVAQWDSIGLGFVDNNITLEDEPGTILMQDMHRVSFEEDGDSTADILDASVHQSWPVLPAYQHSRILTDLDGQIAIPHNSTTVTGTTTIFTSQVKVGETFQTADENVLLEEDTSILMENDERIEYEEFHVYDVQNLLLDPDVMGIQIQDFRWLITAEDTTIAAHTSHAGVIGRYAQLNTADESFWIVTSDSNSDLNIGLEAESGTIEYEQVEWETNDLQLEDGSKYLLTDPGEFQISTITNDTSLTVTRKHWGGTDVVMWRQ